ncbi:hypothetical protein [Streptomyces mirabilis]|uniref:hypothetical protein n=1 Tax=Streptomyces mirabilis TaxID=68239 RepID=UPI0036DF873F
MPKHWHEGDPVPEGLRSDTTIDVAVVAISAALAAGAGVMSEAEMEDMFQAWVNSASHNSPEGNAGLIMAIATLAAAAYARLADHEDASPLALIQAEAAMAETLASFAKSRREGS